MWAVGVLSTATLLGSALATLAVGAWGHRYPPRALLLGAAALMAGTGVAFAGFESFWPLAVVAFVGTLNPSSGDVSVFLPLEHARLASAAAGERRTVAFARYSLAGALAAACGALAAALPAWAARRASVSMLDALRAMFVAYALAGLAIAWLYRMLPSGAAVEAAPRAALGVSRVIVVRLAALFSVDAFAGGLIVNSLLSLWLMQRFGMSIAGVGALFFATGVLAAVSMLAAPKVAERIGLLNTMVFTHIPANACLIGAALAPGLELAIPLLLVRALLAQMDVPTRSAYVMGVVTPPERAAAASFTAVPRSLAAAIAPSLAAAWFASGWIAAPLLAAGALKIAYDLALWRACRKVELRA